MAFNRKRPDTENVGNLNAELNSDDFQSCSDSDAMFQYILKKNIEKNKDQQNNQQEKIKKEKFKDPFKFLKNENKLRKNFGEYGEVVIDSYRPLQIRGRGAEREGMCPHCRCFFKLKTSNYWYHLNYTHGITPRGIPYPPAQNKIDKTGNYAKCPACREEIRLGKKPNSTFMAPYFKHYYKNHRKEM